MLKILPLSLHKPKFFSIWLFTRKICRPLDWGTRRGLSVEEMLKLRSEWQERVSSGVMWEEKTVYLMVEMGLTYSKRKRKAR